MTTGRINQVTKLIVVWKIVFTRFHTVFTRFLAPNAIPSFSICSNLNVFYSYSNRKINFELNHNQITVQLANFCLNLNEKLNITIIITQEMHKKPCTKSIS